MNQRVVSLVCVAVFAGCGPGGGAAAWPEVKDVKYFTDVEQGAALTTLWSATDVPLLEGNRPAVVAGGAPATATDDVVVLQLAQETAVSLGLSRHAPDAGLLSKQLVESASLCEAAGCPRPQTYSIGTYDTSPVPGGGLVAALSLQNPGSGWSGTFVVRFDAAGAVLWSKPIERPGQGLHVLGLSDGRVALAHDFEPKAGTSLEASRGLRVELFDAAGERQVLQGLVVQGLDSKDEWPETAQPFIRDLVGFADGSFAVVGYWVHHRLIQCGSQDNPMVPNGSACSFYRNQGLVAKYAADGRREWAVTTGPGFLGPATSLHGATQLADGSLVVTGWIAVNTEWESAPILGGLVARLAPSGVIRSMTRVCPCKPNVDGEPVMAMPLARANGAVDVLAGLETDTFRVLRFDRDDALHTVRAYAPAGVPVFPSSWQDYTGVDQRLGDSWVLWENPRGATVVRRIKLAD